MWIERNNSFKDHYMPIEIHWDRLIFLSSLWAIASHVFGACTDRFTKKLEGCIDVFLFYFLKDASSSFLYFFFPLIKFLLLSKNQKKKKKRICRWGKNKVISLLICSSYSTYRLVSKDLNIWEFRSCNIIYCKFNFEQASL